MRRYSVTCGRAMKIRRDNRQKTVHQVCMIVMGMWLTVQGIQLHVRGAWMERTDARIETLEAKVGR